VEVLVSDQQPPDELLPMPTDPGHDDESTAFPAGEQVPGQAESRSAYQRFSTMLQVQIAVNEAEQTQRPEVERIDWWQEYMALRAEGWDWRKAAYIAWASAPTDRRWPATQDELARKVLGLTSDRMISKWKQDEPGMQARIEELRVAPLTDHLRDVIEALVDVAKRHDPAAFSDRRMYLEILKVYQPKGQMALTGEDGGPVDVVQIYIPDNGRDTVAQSEDQSSSQPD